MNSDLSVSHRLSKVSWSIDYRVSCIHVRIYCSQANLISYAKTLFHIEDFDSSKFLSLIGEDTIISQIGPLSLVRNDDSKSSM